MVESRRGWSRLAWKVLSGPLAIVLIMTGFIFRMFNQRDSETMLYSLLAWLVLISACLAIYFLVLNA